MVHTVVIHKNHKGLGASKVAGEEYIVDATIDISTYTALGEVVTASELGLSFINCVLITGRQVISGKTLNNVVAEIAELTGLYAANTSFKLVSTLASTGAVGVADGTTGAVRLRVYGQI